MELIIVTGLSGAGKSNALNCLEDMGDDLLHRQYASGAYRKLY